MSWTDKLSGFQNVCLYKLKLWASAPNFRYLNMSYFWPKDVFAHIKFFQFLVITIEWVLSDTGNTETVLKWGKINTLSLNKFM